MDYLGILTFGVVILTIPTLLGAGIAFLLTRQQKNISIMWRLSGYLLYTLLFAAICYFLFFSHPRQGCDFTFLLVPFLLPSWIVSIIFCSLIGRYYRKNKSINEKLEVE